MSSLLNDEQFVGSVKLRVTIKTEIFVVGIVSGQKPLLLEVFILRSSPPPQVIVRLLNALSPISSAL